LQDMPVEKRTGMRSTTRGCPVPVFPGAGPDWPRSLGASGATEFHIITCRRYQRTYFGFGSLLQVIPGKQDNDFWQFGG